MLAWYVLHVKSNCEPMVESRLEGFCSVFWPHRWVKTTLGKQERMLRRPWFPGYVFARCNWDDPVDRAHIASTPRIVEVLSMDNRAAAVPDSEIQALRTLMEKPASVYAHPYLHAGDKVRVVRGPLAGAEGFLVRSKHGGARLVVSVDLLGRSVASEIDADTVEPLYSSPKAA